MQVKDRPAEGGSQDLYGRERYYEVSYAILYGARIRLKAFECDPSPDHLPDSREVEMSGEDFRKRLEHLEITAGDLQWEGFGFQKKLLPESLINYLFS